MKRIFTIAAVCALGLMALETLSVSRAAAQDPVLTPIIASEAAPIVVKTVTPERKATGRQKFHGYIVHANTAQVTVRARGNDMAIQTFPLSEAVAAKMQKIIDKGGYQYGDKITVYYDSQTHKAVKIKGKPSRPL
jgi:hypothetical protein